MNDNTTQSENLDSTDESINADDNDGSVDEKTEQNSAPDEQTTDSTEIEVTPATVAELHRRLLAADSALTDAETHLTAVTELIGPEPTTDASSRSPSVSAELDAAITKLEDTVEQIDEALTGARTLRESAEAESSRGGDAGRKETVEQTSIFDEEGYVRNTSDTCSGDLNPQ